MAFHGSSKSTDLLWLCLAGAFSSFIHLVSVIWGGSCLAVSLHLNDYIVHVSTPADT
jgi:hypothetical protein